jgi:putative Ca2+/H+ antiporter (TMEM165/GDT1 family)
MSAFTINVTLAVIFGAGLSLIIPHNILHIISGGIFILLGILIFKDGKKRLTASSFLTL